MIEEWMNNERTGNAKSSIKLWCLKRAFCRLIVSSLCSAVGSRRSNVCSAGFLWVPPSGNVTNEPLTCPSLSPVTTNQRAPQTTTRHSSASHKLKWWRMIFYGMGDIIVYWRLYLVVYILYYEVWVTWLSNVHSVFVLNDNPRWT